MEKLNACKRKIKLWESLPDLDTQGWSEKQWKEVMAHTQNCKLCQKEIRQVAAWAESNISSDALLDIYHEDLIPSLLGIEPAARRSAPQASRRLLIVNAVRLFNNESEPAQARTKIHEYLQQKHWEMKLTLKKT